MSNLARACTTVCTPCSAASFGDVRSNKKLAGLKGVWRVGSPNRKPWLVSGWSTPQTDDRPFRYLTATEGTILVPNLVPERQLITVWMRASGSVRVTVEWNGDRVAEADLTTTWIGVAFERGSGDLHTSELTVKAQAVAQPKVRVDVADITVEVQ